MSMGKSDQNDKTLWLSKHAWNRSVPLGEDYFHCIYKCHISHWAVDSRAILGRHSISVSWVSGFMCKRYLLLFKNYHLVLSEWCLPFIFIFGAGHLLGQKAWVFNERPISVSQCYVFGHSLVSRGKVSEKVASSTPGGPGSSHMEVIA